MLSEQGRLTAEESEAEPDDRSAERRHALWSLTVLGLITIVVVTAILFLAGTPSHPREHHYLRLAVPTQHAAPTAPATSAGPATATTTSSAPAQRHTSPGAPRHSARATTSAPAAHSTVPAPPPAPRSTEPAAVRQDRGPADPCQDDRACVLGGDGGAARALEAARQADGAGTVATAVTAAAQSCAASGGSDCAGLYAIQTAPQQDGAQAIDTLLGNSGNAWLVSPQTTSVQLGWAYLPDLGQYVLAVLRVS